MTTPTAADACVDALARAGVKRFYAVPGESFLEILDAVERHPDLQLVSTRHESGAAFMAEAEGKLTGTPAVAMATRGVGAANLSIGIHTARQDSTPMLVLLGQVSTDHLDREAFQEVDLPSFLSEVTKWGVTLRRSDRAAEITAEAVRQATTPRQGPVAMAFPSDVLGGDCPPLPVHAARRIESEPPAEFCDELARMLRDAARPVLITGPGVYGAFHEVVAFAARFGLGVYSSFRRQDSFPNDHPNYLGTLALGAPSSTLSALRDADLVLALGSRLDEVTTQGYTLPTHQQTLIQVGEDLASHRTHRVPDIEVDCAPGRLVSRMLQLETGAERDWTREHAAYLEASEPPGLGDGGGINPGHVIKLLADHLPQDTILTNDAGNFSSFAHRYWRFTHPHTQLGPISGAMGYGVPAAIAAKLAHPGRRVVGLAGDGGFLMTGMELETAVRTGAAITVVVFQNRLYGTIAMHQAKTMGRLAGVDIGDVDIVGMARGLGVAATAVRDRADLDDAIADLPADAPSLLCVETDPNVISPSTTLDQILPHAMALTPSALH